MKRKDEAGTSGFTIYLPGPIFSRSHITLVMNFEFQAGIPWQVQWIFVGRKEVLDSIRWPT